MWVYRRVKIAIQNLAMLRNADIRNREVSPSIRLKQWTQQIRVHTRMGVTFSAVLGSSGISESVFDSGHDAASDRSGLNEDAARAATFESILSGSWRICTRHPVAGFAECAKTEQSSLDLDPTVSSSTDATSAIVDHHSLTLSLTLATHPRTAAKPNDLRQWDQRSWRHRRECVIDRCEIRY